MSVHCMEKSIKVYLILQACTRNPKISERKLKQRLIDSKGDLEVPLFKSQGKSSKTHLGK